MSAKKNKQVKETVVAKKAVAKKRTASSPQLKKPKEENKPERNVQQLLKANFIALGCLAALTVSNLGLVWYSASSKKEVIAITETGSIINPIPLPQAFVTDGRVLSYVDTCLRESFSHDFENYRRTVNAAMSCYTQSGGEEFKRELEKTLQEITSKRLVMSITLEPPSLIRGPYIVNGRATWEAQTIITLFYQGTNERYAPQRFAANISVVRVPLEESTSGISVNSMQLTRTNLSSFY